MSILTRCFFLLRQSNIGGKVILLSANLPNAGPGALKVREDPKLYNTAKVGSLSNFYTYATHECSFDC